MRLYILGLILVFLLPGTSGEVTEKKEEEIFEFPLSCREVIYETATDPLSCAKVPRSALGFNDNDTDTEAGWEVPNLEKAIEVDDESTERFVWNKELQLWIKTPPGAAGIFGDNDMPGSCRWDFHRASVYKTDQACLCPATEQTCGKSERCWWYEVGRLVVSFC